MYYNREESRTFAPPIARTMTFAASDGYSCARLVFTYLFGCKYKSNL